MSGTKRTPIARQPALQVSPRAVALFVAIERTQRQRNAADCVPDTSGSGSGYCAFECASCKERARLDNELWGELMLKPWNWPCLDYNPYPPGSPRSRKWRPDPDCEQHALWQLLDEAKQNCAA